MFVCLSFSSFLSRHVPLQQNPFYDPLSAPGCCRICTFKRIARFPFLLSGISCLFFDKQQQEGDAREITIREMGTDRQRKVRSQKQTGSITVHGPAPLPPPLPGLRGAPRSTFPLKGEMFFWRLKCLSWIMFGIIVQMLNVYHRSL